MLPADSVSGVASYSKSAVNSALRRIAVERLEALSSVTARVPYVISPSRLTAPIQPQDKQLQGEAIVAVFLGSVILLLVIWFFFVLREKRADKTA